MRKGDPTPSYVGAISKARDLITKLQIREPSEIIVESIAAYLGAPIRYALLDSCDGRMVRIADSALITVNQTIERVGQRRFVIAHELGHVLLHPYIRQLDEVDVSQTRNFNHNQSPEELEANYFAAELLMPKCFMEPDVKGKEPSWELIRDLAKRYKTTLTSTAIQFVHFTKEPVFFVTAVNGNRKWFVYSEAASDFYLSDSTKVHFYTCAHELKKEGKRNSRGHVPAGAWLRGFDLDGKENITEDAITPSNGDFTMSLLWIHEAI